MTLTEYDIARIMRENAGNLTGVCKVCDAPTDQTMGIVQEPSHKMAVENVCTDCIKWCILYSREMQWRKEAN